MEVRFMRTEKIKKAVIREDLLSITNDFRKAIILNQFIYWSERISDADKFIEKENEIARSNGENEKELFYGWIYKTAEELAEEVMLGLSASQIRRYINDLVKMGYISKRNNPKYKWDRTLQYRVNLVNIAKALKKNGYPLSEYKINIPDEESAITHLCTINNAHEKNQSIANERAIPEITNRDYNTENNKTKYAFPSEKCDTPSDKFSREYILKAINNIMVLQFGMEENSDKSKELTNIVLYFFEQYEKKFNKKHPNIAFISYVNIIKEYLHPFGDNMAYIDDLETYQALIDKYFEENYNAQGNYDKEINLSLSHFMSGEIREHLCNRDGVLWERC